MQNLQESQNHLKLIAKKLFLSIIAIIFISTLNFAQTVYQGNDNDGLNGTLGNGHISFNDNSTTISCVFTAATAFQSVLVIYIDSKSGGFSTTSTFDDSATPLRRVVSGYSGTNRSIVNFPSDFTADYAIAMSPVNAVQDGQLFELSATGSHTAVGTVNFDPNDNVRSSTYTFDFDFSEIGITSADSFQFVATYLNQYNVWRSNEVIGDIASFSSPGGHSALTFTAARTYPMSSVAPAGLALSINAFLQGPYDTTSSMMSDGLRAAGNIPTTSPYGDGATIESTVLDVTGAEAIVDWVQISLHDPTDTSTVISTTSALLQRNGFVVTSNRNIDLVINAVPGDYYVSINHRNHIPVITAALQSLSTIGTYINFTNLSTVRGGDGDANNAMAEVATGVYALFSGDVNGNNQVQVDDYNAAIQDVGRGGYLASDVDMNGELQVSDINFVLKTLGKGVQF